MYSIADIDWETILKGPFTASPNAWEDQVLYFLLVDRFSGADESRYRDNMGEIISSGETPPFRSDEIGNGFQSPEEAIRWRRAGGTWCGGNLRGLTTKLGYLKRLGIGAIWVSPVLKQAPWASDCYHGYGTQNFLEIDPHFGTRDDLRALGATAHSLGMYVILDVILNHTGDVFAYAEEGDLTWRPESYPVAGFRDRTGAPTLPFGPLNPTEHLDGGVWPRELQSPDTFTRKGRISNWDQYPEYEEGDFFDFKDLYLGDGEGKTFQPSEALRALTECYKYWLAFADLDGFRVDTVKHLSRESVAWFTREIHEFAESIGKRNFYLIGEIVGDRGFACGTLLSTDMDAALGIGEVPQKIRGIVHGTLAPTAYFDIFVNSRREGECHPGPVWWRNRVVTFFDDHDQVGKEIKGRLASEFGDDRRHAELGVLRAVAFQSLTLGIPCLYYGTEQGFDGHVPREGEPFTALQDPDLTDVEGPCPDDQVIRECLFGGPFGPFRSQGRHFFDETTWLYRQIARLLELRKAHPALRRGRQYLRELSIDGETFWTPTPGEEPYRGVIAWSRLLDVDELICALNTDNALPQKALVTVDDSRHGPDSGPLTCLYSTDPAQVGQEVCPVRTANGSAVPITVPAGGFVLFR